MSGSESPSARTSEPTAFINGQLTTFAEGETVADVLENLGRDPRAVAIELNGDIVPRNDYSRVRLADSDRLEIVQFVQGG